MAIKSFRFVAVNTFIVWLLSGPASGAEGEAYEIEKKSQDLVRGETAHMTWKMHIVNPDYERTTTMESWSSGLDKSFIKVTSPAKEKGNTYLKIGNNIWQYVKSVDEEMKIMPTMMYQGMMGSEFTYDDMVREDSFADDMSVMKRIGDPGPVYRVIEGARYVRAYSPRVKTYALAAAHGNSGGAFILAFDPARERAVSNMHKTLTEGRYLTPGRDREVVLAFALAENLGVSPGDEVAILVQAADGSLGLVGICDPGISTMNNTLAMMNLPGVGAFPAPG